MMKLLQRRAPSAGEATTGGSLSERAVDRLTRAVAPAKVDRRGFLWRSALTGTALAVNPFDFALKPGTAYASVCGSGASCSSGWTAFCCTINNGSNLCPPGSYRAGWWRVDDSAFCRGSARYIIDCNRLPGSSCRCRCASGSCDQRRVCCNNFRYGQCNQHISGVTEVVCRAVTCTPPWQLDSSCTRTVRVDNRTASHSAPCLPGTNPSHIEMKYQDLGLTGARVGTPDGSERDGDNGGRVRRHTNGWITYLPAVGAWSVMGREATVFDNLGLESGRLGYPIRDRQTFNWGSGWYQRFQRGWITHRDDVGTHPVWRPYWGTWVAQGGGKGRRLGLPRGPLGEAADGGGYVQVFEHGAILRQSGSSDAVAVYTSYWDAYRRTGGTRGPLGYPNRPRRASLSGRGGMQGFTGGMLINARGTGLRAVLGTTKDRYQDLGYDESFLGFPTARRLDIEGSRGTVQPFEGGAIYATEETGAWEIEARFRERYLALDSVFGPLGYPTGELRQASDDLGYYQNFEHGRFYLAPGTGRRALWGPIDARYRQEGGPVDSGLGYPNADVAVRDDGREVARFQRGRIVHDPSSGEVTIERD